MRKVFIVLLILTICMSIGFSTALAEESDRIDSTDRGSLTLTCSMTKVSGTVNTYKVKGKVSANNTESLKITVSLYNPAGTLIGISSNQNTGTSVSASFNKALSSGRYKVVVKGTGNTETKTKTVYYNI